MEDVELDLKELSCYSANLRILEILAYSQEICIELLLEKI